MIAGSAARGRGRGALGPVGACAAGAAILVSASVLAAKVDRPWSWPLFVWGAVVGVVAIAWAYTSTRAFGLLLLRRLPDQRAAIESRADGLWARQRWTYLMLLAFGCAVGIIAGGTHRAFVDVAFTVLWVVAGVLPPLIAFPILNRKAKAAAARR